MKPWMGAIAAAIAIAAAPSAALADDGVSVVQFKLPNKASGRDVRGARRRPRPRVQSRAGRRRARQRRRDAEEQARFEALGYPAVNTLQTPAYVDALRAERDGDDRAPRTPPPTRSPAPRRSRPRARPRARSAPSARTSGRTSRAPTSRSRARRREATMNGNTLHAARRSPPPGLTPAARSSAPAASRRSTDARPVPLPRLALPGRRPRHADAGEHPRRGAQRRRRHARRQALGRRQRHHEPRRLHPGLHHPLRRRRVRRYEKIRLLAERVPEHRELLRLPNKTNGYQRKAQTVIGNGTPYTGARRRIGRPGHGRRPHVATPGATRAATRLTAEIMNAGAPSAARGHASPATRSRSRRRPTPPARSPAPPRRSSPRSTPTRRPRRS